MVEKSLQKYLYSGMFYEFPVDISLDEVRIAIARANERLGSPVFVEVDRGDHIIFNYMISFREVWDFPEEGMGREYAILRECRGLTFMKDGRLVGRKFHKFHNVNERIETQLEAIDWTEPHVVLDKLDGSMITPYLRGDDVFWCTKLGITEVAEKVRPFVSHNPQYDEFARFCWVNEITPMFEFCSMKQRIVIAYPQDRLVLLAARSNRTGAYYGMEQLVDWATAWNIDLVSVREVNMADPKSAIEAVRGLKGEEGVIVRFETGHMVKIKADEYCLIHGTVSDIVSEKNVINLIVSGGIDDALPLLPPDGRAQMEKFIAAFNAGIDATVSEVKALADEGVRIAGANSGKEFAAYVAKQPGLLHRAIFHAAIGRDARNTLMLTLEKSIGSGPRIDEVRSLWGGHKWVWSGSAGED